MRPSFSLVNHFAAQRCGAQRCLRIFYPFVPRTLTRYLCKGDDALARRTQPILALHLVSELLSGNTYWCSAGGWLALEQLSQLRRRTGTKVPAQNCYCRYGNDVLARRTLLPTRVRAAMPTEQYGAKLHTRAYKGGQGVALIRR